MTLTAAEARLICAQASYDQAHADLMKSSVDHWREHSHASLERRAAAGRAYLRADDELLAALLCAAGVES